MNIELNLDKDFEAKVNDLKNFYGENMERMNGFHNDNLNFTSFIDNFIDASTVADATIDGNANSNTKDVSSLVYDMIKPHTKLLGFNKVYYEMKKKYGRKRADNWLEAEWNGTFYMNNATDISLKPYCFAYDLTPLIEKGLFFNDGMPSKPAKHLSTYNEHILQFVSYCSKLTTGAVGMPNYLVYSYYFWKKDVENNYLGCAKDPEGYRNQYFQSFIYNMNQTLLRVNQSAFTNVTIFDSSYYMELFGGLEFPDGSLMMNDCNEFLEYEKAFMEMVSKIRGEQYFTFPVLTYSLLFQDGKFVDEEFAKWCIYHNCDWADSNVYNGEDVSTLSNCCFDGDQLTLTKSSNGINLMSFSELYKSNYNDTKRNFTVFHNGSWVKGKLITTPKRKMYKITTANKKELIVTDNHIFPTINGDKSVYNITTDDYIMFSNRKLDTFPEKDEKLTYDEGFLVGMYLGDGSSYLKENSEQTPAIMLSLNKSKYDKCIPIVDVALNKLDNTAKFTLGAPKNNVYPTTIRNWTIYNFIKRWVVGNYAYCKELNMDCLLQSYEFRKGILDGYYETDGGNSNRIYTTSEKLIPEIECLMTSLGLNSIIDVSDRTDEIGIIRGETFNHNYPVYCIRWYNSLNKRSRENVFKVKNNSEYFKVIKIEDFDSKYDETYCFEMENSDEPYFTLPNGIISHNCRLLADQREMNGFINSIGGTGLSIGSAVVNTINLRRIALISEGSEDRFMELLEYYTELSGEVMDVVRGIITRNVEKGLLPNYTHGLIDINKQFNTIGILGLYECVREFGYIDVDKLGNHSYSDKGMNFASKIFEYLNAYRKSTNFNYPMNIESIPGERASVVMCNKDVELFGNKYDDWIYSNQWIPLMVKCTLDEKIRLGSILDKQCGGGAISHINIERPFADKEQAWKLANEIAKRGLIYYAFNTKMSIDVEGHSFYGEICPKDGEKRSDYVSKIVGFLVPMSSYSKERKREFKERKWFEF